MFKWLFNRPPDNGKPRLPIPHPAADTWTGTTREQWTMPGVYFGSDGWRLTEARDAQMDWVGLFGGTMTLTRNDVPAWTAAEIDLDVLRQKHRTAAAKRDGGIVSVEVVEMASGSLALEVLTKYRSGPGYDFEGLLLVDEAPLGYSLALAAAEETTGVRESIVSGLRMQLGEIDIASLMSAPVDPASGGRRMPGMKLDPYDAACDEHAVYSASDDLRLDEFLQTHPLSVIRSSLRRARATWECSPSAAREPNARQALPNSAGPKAVLSDAFFRTLREMAQNG